MDPEQNNYIPWSVIVRVINRYLTFYLILNHYEPENSYNIHKIDKDHSLQIYCPFHDNTNTKAATLYKDKDGVECIWCYAETKRFSPYDLLKKYVDTKEIYKIFKNIWNLLKEQDRIYFLNQEEFFVEKFDQNTIDFFNTIEKFKRKEKNYTDVLSIMLDFEERNKNG